MNDRSREYSWDLLNRYNKDSYHLKHALVMEGVMKYFAAKLGYSDEADFWGGVGLLHDIDFELYPEEHCLKAQEILRENDYSDRFIRAVVSHGYEMHTDTEPEHEMEKILYAADELSGLILAAALMRPSKSVMDLELSSVRKKFKSSSFAAGCSREVISKGAQMLGWELDYLIESSIMAVRESGAAE